MPSHHPYAGRHKLGAAPDPGERALGRTISTVEMEPHKPMVLQVLVVARLEPAHMDESKVKVTAWNISAAIPNSHSPRGWLTALNQQISGSTCCSFSNHGLRVMCMTTLALGATLFISSVVANTLLISVPGRGLESEGE